MNAKLNSLVFTSLSHFSVDGNFLLFPVLLTYYAGIKGLSVFVIGLMPVLYNLISGFLSVYVGSYADRVDRDSVILMFGLILNGLAAFVFSLAFLMNGAAYEFMIIGSVLLGVGQSIYHPIGATILSHTFGPRESASYMGINGSFGSLGRSAFPPMVVFIAGFVGIVLGLQVIVIYFIVAAVLILLGLRFFKRKDYQYSLPVKQKISTKDDSLEGKVPFFLIMLVLLVFLRSMFISVTTTWVPTYLDAIFNSKHLMATILGIAFLAPVLGQPFFGYLTSKFGGKFTISLTSVGLVVFFVLFLYFSRGFAIILISYTFFAFFAYTGFPVLMGYVSQIVPKEHSTRANALVWGLGNTIGGSVGLLLFDGLRLFASMFLSFTVLLVFAIVSVFLLIYLPSREKLEKS
ncbi:MAG: MFS transporter [Thermoplasmatales archaeon]|jgi:MFS family permease|nr:MFS transporter [Candidatus Thermoplasmatota archaeon]MCL6003315.1 MFS transporter [Candidatus Thermoplasmatota archaeon]MDA8055397.1 MFS transporter [Thermoplasmatales archaeon]